MTGFQYKSIIHDECIHLVASTVVYSITALWTKIYIEWHENPIHNKFWISENKNISAKSYLSSHKVVFEILSKNNWQTVETIYHMYAYTDGYRWLHKKLINVKWLRFVIKGWDKCRIYYVSCMAGQRIFR